MSMQQKNYRIRSTSAGLEWFKQASALLKNNMARWNFVMFIYLIFALFSIQEPLILVLFFLFNPVMWNGFFLSGLASSQKMDWNPSILFASLKTHYRPLLMLGMIVLIIKLIIGSSFQEHLATFMDMDALQAVIEKVNKTGDKTPMLEFLAQPGLLDQLFLSIALFLLISLPLTMATWFAPMLIFHRNYGLGQALKESFQACSANFLAFFVYGLIMLACVFMIIISFYIAVIFLGPLIFATIYTSFMDIWPDEVVENSNPDSTLTV